MPACWCCRFWSRAFRFLPACIALAAFAGLYTAAGGLRAVVYTDVLQAIVLLAGAGVITYEIFAQFDFSWAAAMASIPPEKMSLMRPLDDPALPWLGVVIGLPVLGFYYWGTNQYIMQRVLGARSLDQARWGAMLAAALEAVAALSDGAFRARWRSRCCPTSRTAIRFSQP